MSKTPFPAFWGKARLSHRAVQAIVFACAPMSAMAQGVEAMPISLATAATASENVLTGVMGLREAFDAARLKDASLRATRAQTDGVKERLEQAKAQLRPNVSFSATRYDNDLSRTQPGFTGQLSTTQDRYFSYSQTLQLRQPLYRPALPLAVEQARAQIGDAEAVFDREVQNLGVRVVESYLQVLLAQEREALLAAQLKLTQAQLDAARKRFEGGQGIRTDIDEAQARLDLTQAQQLEASQSRQTALLQLQVMVQQPVQRVWPLATAALNPDAYDVQTLAAWMDKAEKTSPEIKALQARVEAARLEVQRAQASHKPTLDAVVQVSRSGSENVTSPQSSYTNRQVGLQFNLPLYAGGAVQSAVRQALAEQVRLEETLDAVRRDLSVRVQKEWRGVTEGALRMRAQQRVVASSDQVVTSVRRSYEGGVRTVLDVLNAEQQAQLARRDLAEVQLGYVASRLRLLGLVGELSADNWQLADRWFQPPIAHAVN
ncbi:MAG: channel protein TolC [Polaromonas sp.]|nr:channel protein TolC [Polaromonas sp.]